MPISIDAPKKDLCRGGGSFNCRQISETADPDSRTLGPHEPRSRVWCRRCDKYMGCAICAQPLTELVCNFCRDWATDAAERLHGRMLPRDEALTMFREVEKLTEKLTAPKVKPSTYRRGDPLPLEEKEPEREPDYWQAYHAAMEKHRAEQAAKQAPHTGGAVRAG